MCPLLDLWTSLAVITLIIAVTVLVGQWLEYRHDERVQELENVHETALEMAKQDAETDDRY